MAAIATLLRTMIHAFAALGVAAYGAAALVTVADILGRRIGLPVQGVVDLVQLFVVTGAWLVMPYAFLAAAMVSVDFLRERLPAGLTLALRAVATALAFGLVALMLWQGYATFETRTMFGDRSQQLGIPIAWYWYPLLLGLAMALPAILLELAAPRADEAREVPHE